jgi:hypothetical protein
VYESGGNQVVRGPRICFLLCCNAFGNGGTARTGGRVSGMARAHPFQGTAIIYIYIYIY